MVNISMSKTTDPDTMAELIADCASIPDSLQIDAPTVRLPKPREWSVDEKCHAQVAEFSPYI